MRVIRPLKPSREFAGVGTLKGYTAPWYVSPTLCSVNRTRNRLSYSQPTPWPANGAGAPPGGKKKIPLTLRVHGCGTWIAGTVAGALGFSSNRLGTP